MHLLGQVGQHVFDHQGIGIQCQIKVDIIVFCYLDITIHIYNIAVQADLALVEMTLHILDAELQRQFQVQGVIFEIGLV